MLLLILTLGTLPVSRQAWGEPPPPLPVEASPTVFGTKLGSPQAQLELSGSWNTQLSDSLGFGIDTAGGGLFPAAFPGMTQGFNFQQVPNLNIGLRFLDRYFFRTTFVDTTASPSPTLPLGLNSFVLGYDGKPNEFLQSVRIGNSDVNIGNYDFLSFPDASTNSFGASASFSGGNAIYQAMIRYEPAALNQRVFIGQNEITDQRIAPGSYVDGQYFVLPDANVQNLTVYVEDGTGTIPGSEGHFYRIAGPDTVVVNSTAGTIAFRKPLIGRALVYYTVGGVPVGKITPTTKFLPNVQSGTTELDLSAQSLPFSWGATDPYVSGSTPQTFQKTSQVAINGHNALLIYSPGQFSPFQADNVYSLASNLPAANATVTASLVPNGADSISSVTAGTGSQGAAAFLNLPGGLGLRVSVDATQAALTIYGFTQSGTQPTIDPRSLAARFPFTTLQTIYTAGPLRAPQDTSQQILLRLATPTSVYQLDTDMVTGSVKVLRNGRSETNFTVDYTTGILTFGVPVAASDVILITYRTYNVTQPGGELFLGLGADFALTPRLNLDLGAGLRWAVFSGSYSTTEGTNTGSALLTAGLHYNEKSTEGLRGSLEAGVSLSSPDTTGNFQLFGMEGDGITVPMVEGALFPSSIPSDPATEFFGTAAASRSFTAAKRGELLYNDYHLYTAGGAVLQQIGWPIPASQQYPYAAGSYTGPYPVFDPSQGVVMVMDYRMSAAQWVGAQTPLPGAPEDLSGAESISFEVNSTLSGSSIQAYLQIGAVGENLDGTTTLETSGSTAVKAFPFNDNGTILTTTGGASPATGGLYASEDTNGNGLLDLENPSLVVTKAITVPSQPGWNLVQFSLSPADRAMLTHVDAIRIVLVDAAGTSVAGTFQLSGFSIAEAPFHVDVNPNTTTIQEVSDPQPAGKQLEDLFPEVKTVFHPTGLPQKVLEVSWASATSTNPAWHLVGYPNAVSAGVYQNLDFYLLGASSGTAPTLSLNLTDQNGSGVRVEVPVPEDDTWHKYSVNLSSGAITLDGKAIAQLAAVDGGVQRYTRLTIASSGAARGTLYIDEIHLSHAIVRLSAGATLDGVYSKQGIVAAAFGIPILKDLSVKEQASLTGPDFASGFATFPNETALSSYTQLTGSLPFGRLGLQFGVAATPTQVTLSGGHSLDVPIGPVTVGDSYSQTVESGQMTFNRSDQINLSFGSILSAGVQDSATDFGPSLDQTIQTNASVNPAGPLSLSLTGNVGNQVDQFTPASLQYFPNWIDSFRLLAPVAESDAVRSGSLQLASQLALGPKSRPTSVQLSLQPSASYQSSLQTERIQTNSGGVTLSLPIATSAAGFGGLTVTPAYTRSFSTSLAAPANATFSQDLSTYGAALAGASYLYESLPFAELFSPATEALFAQATAGLAAAQYEPQVSVTVARQSGSYIRDLYLPSQLQLSLGRTLDRQADTVTDNLAWQVAYVTDALNLFGSAGAYPFFHFYQTEEIANNIDVAGTGTGLSSAIVQNLLTLYLRHKSQIQLQHRLSLTWNTPNSAAVANLPNSAFQLSDQVTLSFVYVPRLHFVLPYVPAQLQTGSYLENTETLTFASAPDLTANSLQVNVSHETALILPEHGQVTATAGFGIAENQISSQERRILFGIQASVGAQLSF